MSSKRKQSGVRDKLPLTPLEIESDFAKSMQEMILSDSIGDEEYAYMMSDGAVHFDLNFVLDLMLNYRKSTFSCKLNNHCILTMTIAALPGALRTVVSGRPEGSENQDYDDTG